MRIERLAAPLALCACMGTAIPRDAAAQAAAPSISAEVTELDRRTALLEAQAKLLKAENELATLRFPLLDGDAGKKGTITVESGERDKFHVTARSAEAFQAAARELAGIVNRELSSMTPASATRRVVILSAADRSALATYRAEAFALEGVERRRKLVIPPSLGPEGVGLLSAGSALLQIAQFTQLFRTDINLAFTDSLLPDTLLTDMVAVELGAKARYPSGELERLFAQDNRSRFATQLVQELKFREELGKKGDSAKPVLTELDALSTRLAASDPLTKLPALYNVLRGELASDAMANADLSLTIDIASKGGTSMKTSNMFRSDRLYAAGGVIVTYRLATLGADSRIFKADVITRESGLVRVELK